MASQAGRVLVALAVLPGTECEVRERSKVLVRKKFSRAQLLAYTANLPSSRIGLETCSGAHFRDRGI